MAASCTRHVLRSRLPARLLIPRISPTGTPKSAAHVCDSRTLHALNSTPGARFQSSRSLLIARASIHSDETRPPGRGKDLHRQDIVDRFSCLNQRETGGFACLGTRSRNARPDLRNTRFPRTPRCLYSTPL